MTLYSELTGNIQQLNTGRNSLAGFLISIQ